MARFATIEEVNAFLDAPVEAAPQQPQGRFRSIEEVDAFLDEPQSGILRQAADIPVSAAGGVIGGLKGVSDIFGAGNPVSLTLADYRKFYQDAMSPEGKADAQRAAAIMQEAQDKGVLAQAGAAARAFAVNPLDTIAGAAGSLAPTIATGVLGKAVGLGAKGIQAAQIAMGAGQGAGFIKGSIYDATKQYLLEQGIPEDKAEAAAIEAQKYNGENWDQIALGLGLGAAASGIGLERIIGKAIGGGVKDASKNIVTAGIKAAVQEGVPEAAQGGQEQLAQNLALIRQGANIPAMRGVVSQATLEGLAGMAAGGPVGIADYVQTPDMVQRARQAAAAPASFVPTPEVDPALVAAEFGDVTDSQQTQDVAVQQQEAAAQAAEQATAQADAPIEQPSGPPISIPATQPAVDRPTPSFPSARPDATLRTLPDTDFKAETKRRARAVEDMESKVWGLPIEEYQAAISDPKTFGEILRIRNEYEQAQLEAFRRSSEKAATGELFSEMLDLADGAGREGWEDSDAGNRLALLAEIIAARSPGQRSDAALMESLAALPERITQDRNWSEVKARKMANVREAMAKVAPTIQQPQSPPTAGDAATVKLYRGIAKTVDYTTGDEFYSASQDVASEYAAQDGKQGEVVETTLADVAKNPYRVFDKAEAAAALGIDLPVTDIGFDAAVKAKLQPMGHDAVIYEAGTDFEGGGEMEVHKFAPTPANSSPATGGEAQPQPAAQTQQGAVGSKTKARIRKNLKPNSGAVDLDIINDLVDYGKQFYRAGMTFGKWAGQMVKEFGQGVARFLRAAYDQIVKSYRESRFSDEAGAVNVTGMNAPKVTPQQDAEYLAAVERGDMETAQRIVDEAAAAAGYIFSVQHGTHKEGFSVFDVNQGRNFGQRFEMNNWGIWTTDDDASIYGPKVLRLYGKSASPLRVQDFYEWFDDYVKHAYPLFYYKGITADELAKDLRSEAEGYFKRKKDIPVGITRTKEYLQMLADQPGAAGYAKSLRDRGFDSVLMEGGFLDGQLQTVRVYLDSSQLKLADTITRNDQGGIIVPSRRFDGGPDIRGELKSRIKYALANSQTGGIDASILADIVEFGRAFYQRGMSFGKWSAQMVAEFGQSVARHLRMAYDRIVQAYKDSPYSSEAGSVGDVRPKQEQESLNRRAKADTGLSDEAKAAMGDGIYDVMPLYGEGNIMDQAIAEIEKLGGLDAAAAKMIEIEKRPGGLEPIEMAMAIHLARQLDATNPVMAGNMVRIASTKGRSMGQANAAIKLFAEIDTATIDHYAQTLVEQEASSVSEDYARLISDAGKDLREAKAEFYKEKLRIIHASILELQTKGEKIITKIREAIPDNARRTKMLDDIRTILKGDIGRQEAIREVAKLMKDNGIPPTSAQAWSNSIVSNVFKLTNKSKAALARDMAKKHSWRVRSWKKLLGEVENGEISDADFLANLTALSGFPHISRATGAKLKKWAAEYKTVKDQRLKEIIAFQIWEEIHSQVPPEIAMQLRAFAYLSMLSYPLTWIKNIGGNSILFAANTAKDALIGTVIDPAVAALRTGKRASVGYGNLGVRIKGLAEPVRVIRRGMKYEQEVNPNATTWERFRVGLRHLRLLSKMTSQNKWDIADAKEAGRRMFGDKFMFGVFGDKVQAPGLMRLWESGLSVALGGPDRAFWEAEFRASLAQREAAAKANGEWTGMHTYADMEAAFEDAARAIFQNANPISQGLGKIRGGLNWLSTLGLTEQFGLGTVLIAFTQVPGSILVRGAFDWSPLGWVANSAYQWFRPSIFRMTKGRFGGQFDQRKFNNAMAEGLLGTTGLVGAGFWLASMGILTASEDDDRDVADANKAQRIMPFSVNLSALGRVIAGDFNKQQPQTGDFTVRYDWAQPLAIAVASGAEMAVQLERARIKGLTGVEAANSVKTVLTAGLKSLEEQPLVSGMASFARTWGFSGLYDALAMTALKAPSMFIPQLVRRSAQYMDNTVRETRGGDFVTRPFQQIAASLPYLSSQYPARIDVTGKPMERFPDAGNTWYNLTINPIVTSRVRLDPVLQEATRLMNMTGEKSQFPRQVGRTTEINGKKVELTNDQITRYNYYVGNMTMAMLQYRMGRAKYQRSSDDEKARLFAKDLSDVAAVARVGVFGADRRKLSPDQRQILREFLKSPIAQSNPPTEASPPQQ